MQGIDVSDPLNGLGVQVRKVPTKKGPRVPMPSGFM